MYRPVQSQLSNLDFSGLSPKPVAGNLARDLGQAFQQYQDVAKANREARIQANLENELNKLRTTSSIDDLIAAKSQLNPESLYSQYGADIDPTQVLQQAQGVVTNRQNETLSRLKYKQALDAQTAAQDAKTRSAAQADLLLKSLGSIKGGADPQSTINEAAQSGLATGVIKNIDDIKKLSSNIYSLSGSLSPQKITEEELKHKLAVQGEIQKSAIKRARDVFEPDFAKSFGDALAKDEQDHLSSILRRLDALNVPASVANTVAADFIKQAQESIWDVNTDQVQRILQSVTAKNLGNDAIRKALFKAMGGTGE